MLIGLVLITLLSPLLPAEEVKFAVASVGENQFCVGFRTTTWTQHRYSPPSEQTYRVQVCSRNTSTTGYSIITGTDRVTDNMIPATLIDQSCDVSDISVGSHVFVKSPFSISLTEKLNASYFTGVMQVRGDLGSALRDNDTVVVRPVQFGRLYWGAIIMYFFSLIYVSTCAVLVEAGRQVVERHAATSPLERLPFTQTRAFLIAFLVLFMVILTISFGGYFMRPLLFQPFFALFLTMVAVVGFYHVVFPIIVFLADKYIRIVNKTYWMVERISVITGGMVIFGLWMNYRSVQNIWPLQLLMFACVGVVPVRYAPVNCILKCVVFTFVAVFFSVLQRYILPAVSPGTPPNFVDIVTIQARIPDTLSPGSLFFPDAREPSLSSFRVPLFGDAAPCSGVLDGTFGMTNFIIPALFIKAAMLTDTRIDSETFLLKNYTAGVLCYLVCHIAVFVWSFAAETPVNSNIVYLPGITIGLLLNSLRMGYLKKALLPPPPEPSQQGAAPPEHITVYKVTAEEQI